MSARKKSQKLQATMVYTNLTSVKVDGMIYANDIVLGAKPNQADIKQR